MLNIITSFFLIFLVYQSHAQCEIETVTDGFTGVQTVFLEEVKVGPGTMGIKIRPYMEDSTYGVVLRVSDFEEISVSPGTEVLFLLEDGTVVKGVIRDKAKRENNILGVGFDITTKVDIEEGFNSLFMSNLTKLRVEFNESTMDYDVKRQNKLVKLANCFDALEKHD